MGGFDKFAGNIHCRYRQIDAAFFEAQYQTLPSTERALCLSWLVFMESSRYQLGALSRWRDKKLRSEPADVLVELDRLLDTNRGK